ncbi:MAG TPA: choice-of-anchor D domain-containing protein, partial [Acidobacteriaceae bacterium]
MNALLPPAASSDAAEDGLRVDGSEELSRAAMVRRIARWAAGCWLGLVWLPGAVGGFAQDGAATAAAPHAVRVQRFLAGRVTESGASAAMELDAARREHLAMAQPAGNEKATGRTATRAAAQVNPLNAAWQAVGPAQIASQKYGLVTGRVTSVAIDPADASGNTVYLGTTGGGVWKSTNAAGAAASIAFVPLTDTLPVFSANAGTTAIPSLSIGAVSVSGGVVLAGTGDPNDASDSYYGEGILRSADGGVTWTLAQGSHDGVAGNHSFAGMGVAGFAWSTLTPKLVVAAMSQAKEGVLVNAPDGTYSAMGLYYSLDAGMNWQMATIKDGSQAVQGPQTGDVPGNAATAVVWNAVRQRFYAAVRFHGYYESADGSMWTRLTHQPGAGLTTTACPVSTSGDCPIFRGALAVQSGTGDTFALTVDANNLDQGLWQDVCGLSGTSCAVTPIAFGKRLLSGPLDVSGSTVIAQADYDLSLAAVGAGSDTVLFVGTEDLYRCSLSAGCALRNTTNAVNGCAAPAMVSPAEHAIAVLSGAGTGGLPLVYLGNDGGVWRSVDGVNEQQTPCSADDATHFQNLNGGLGSLAEVVSFAEHPTDVATLLVGVGANGVAATGGATAGPWLQISASEGGMVAIDAANPQNWYVSTAAGVNLRYCANGSVCAAADFAGAPTIGYAQVANDISLIDAPMLLDPAMATDVAVGTCRVWRGPAQSGSGWSGSNAISAMFGAPQNAACSVTSPMVRALAAGGPASGLVAAQNAGSTVLYAAMAGKLDGGGTIGGHVFANFAAGSASGSTVWTDVAKSTVVNDSAGVFNPGGFDVSSVVMDAHDATGKTVYATVMGFAGNGVNAAHVYRSLDGGAHWTNISSNLPNAPANGVLVDPNDANTLYVAMDTGVYATTQVATCASGNCWSAYGTGLPNAPVVQLAAAPGLATGDGRLGELRAGTYGRGIWQIPLLTAATPAMPAMMLSAGSLTFATQAVATASAAQAITVTNSGNAPLTVSQIVAAGDFNETDNCVGTAVAAGASCAVQVTFLPSATGARAGVLTVYGNVAGGQATVTLSGVGAPAAAIVLNPITVTYSGTNVGALSVAQNITVSNMGGFTVTLQAPVVTGDFVMTANTCGATLAAGVGCTVSVAFKPTASGTRTGSFSIVDSVGTQMASLSGVGVLPATDALGPLSLSFAPQQLNTASATQQVTLTNSGDAALTLVAAQISSGDFTVVNGCGNSLNGHSACSLLVAFVPKSVGLGAGVLTVSDTYRSQTVALNGTGVAPAGVSLSPVSTLTFGATAVGLSAASQTVTLTNNGGMPLLIQSMGATGDFAIVAGGNTCGTSLAPGSACTAQIVFAPTMGGARAGGFTVVDNAGSSPQSLQLTGMGVDFALNANGNTSATIAAGGQAVYPLLLTSAAGVPGTVAFTCGPIPAHSTCTVNPASPALGGTTTITVTVATSVAGAALEWPG